MTLNVHKFAAIKGKQSGDDYFTVVCEMALIPKLFLFNESIIPTELRAQRHINKSRIPEIARYIVDNPNNYIFSALTASIDGDINFKPLKINGKDSEVGELEISGDAKLMINDGQHRRRAIEEALKERPELGHEMISVVFFQDEGLKRSQQMFSDLNKNAVKPTKSLSILYDHRDEFSKFIVNLVNSIEIFEGRVELEKTSISNRSIKVFTLNGISDASMRLFGISKGKKLSDEEKQLVKEFWDTVSKNIAEWQLLLQDKVTAPELRKDFVNTNTNLLNSLGIVGRIIIEEFPKTWKEKLRGLKNINWSRTNPEWEGRLLVHGQMHKQARGIDLAANLILQKCGVTLSEDRQKLEE